MESRSMVAAMLCLATVSACGSSASTNAQLGSGGSAGSGFATDGVGGFETSGGAAGSETAADNRTVLTLLSIAEAPRATQTFFWGTIDVTAPGFVGPPRDEMTIGLGPDNSLRYLSWKTLPMLPKTYGDDTHDFPSSGSRAVDLSPGIPDDYTATVLDAPAPTASHFSLSEHVVSVQGLCDYVESTEGTWTGSGWSAVYSDEGTLWGTTIAAHAQGTLFAGDPSASAPVDGQPSLWSAPVELAAPGFYGPPVDHLTVSLDASGQIRWFSFQNFVRRISFGDNTQELPNGGLTIVDDGTVTFDDVVPATPDHFVIRYQVHSDARLNDYTEGLDGTRQGDTLVVRYFISGKLWGAAINAHAAGTLVPASH